MKSQIQIFFRKSKATLIEPLKDFLFFFFFFFFFLTELKLQLVNVIYIP